MTSVSWSSILLCRGSRSGGGGAAPWPGELGGRADPAVAVPKSMTDHKHPSTPGPLHQGLRSVRRRQRLGVLDLEDRFPDGQRRRAALGTQQLE